MKLKNIVLIAVVLMSVGVASAGEIVTQSGGTVFIYGAVDDTLFMKGQVVLAANDSYSLNYNKTVCINATVIEGQITIINDDAYDLEYNFIADINDTAYISRTVEMKQEVLSSSFISGKTLKRTLTIDAIEIATYEMKYSWFAGLKDDTFYFCLIDDEIRYGDEIYGNISLAFTQLNYQDQQDMIPDAYNAKNRAEHYYRSVGAETEEDSMQLLGLTGWAYNTIGKIPWNIGKPIQALIFMPLAVIQYTFNFIFSFITLIMTNWWYALLLLEIFCIIPALAYHTYPEMAATFISMHVKIFVFMYHKVVLPLIGQILRLIEIIRNLFRI